MAIPYKAELNPFQLLTRSPMGLQGLEPWACGRSTRHAAWQCEQTNLLDGSPFARLEGFTHPMSHELGSNRDCVKRRIAIHSRGCKLNMAGFGLFIPDSTGITETQCDTTNDCGKAQFKVLRGIRFSSE